MYLWQHLNTCVFVASLGLKVCSQIFLNNNLDFLIAVVGMSVHLVNAKEECGCVKAFQHLWSITLYRCAHTYTSSGSGFHRSPWEQLVV